jgi:hypothetical protein
MALPYFFQPAGAHAAPPHLSVLAKIAAAQVQRTAEVAAGAFLGL